MAQSWKEAIRDSGVEFYDKMDPGSQFNPLAPIKRWRIPNAPQWKQYSIPKYPYQLADGKLLVDQILLGSQFVASLNIPGPGPDDRSNSGEIAFPIKEIDYTQFIVSTGQGGPTGDSILLLPKGTSVLGQAEQNAQILSFLSEILGILRGTR